MKIRRITVLVLLALTLLFFLDLKFSGLSALFRDPSKKGISLEMDLSGPNAQKTQHFAWDREQVSALRISDHWGGEIRVAGTEGDQILIGTHLIAKAASASRAEQLLEEWEVLERAEKNQVSYELAGQGPSKGNLKVIYQIQAPPGMKLLLEQKHGMVNVSGWEGDLRLEGQHAEIFVTDFAGSLAIKSNFSHLDLKNIEGAVIVEDAHSTLSLDLINSAAGYDFDLNLNRGDLSGLLPSSLELEETGERKKLRGRVGAGANPVKIKGEFSTLTLSLKD
ncbi:MAG: hypothetical protein GX335_02135 [Firmicutes bacterium]|nr:hypothetical protein [Bacillota bacterium]